jgi:hypothetical protein
LYVDLGKVLKGIDRGDDLPKNIVEDKIYPGTALHLHSGLLDKLTLELVAVGIDELIYQS